MARNDLSKECSKVAFELLIWLNSQKLYHKHRPWTCTLQTLKAVKGIAKIDSMIQTLEGIEQELGLLLLVSLREDPAYLSEILDLLNIDDPRRSLNSVAFEQIDYYRRLEPTTRDIIGLIREGRSCFDTAFYNQARKIEQLHLQAQALNAKQHARTRADVANLHARGSSPTRNFMITTEDY